MKKQKDKSKAKPNKKNKFNKYQLVGAFSLVTIASGMGFFMTGVMESANPELFQQSSQNISKGTITESSASKMITGGGLFLAGAGIGIIAVGASSVKSSKRKPKPPTQHKNTPKA